MSRKRPRILIALPTLMPHDAVGNDALGMYEYFRAAGYQARLFAEAVHPDYRAIARRVGRESSAAWNSPQDILIYHHAIHWELGEILLASARAKVVIKHHNVTPPHFFANYTGPYFEACRRGVEATRRLARHPTAWFWGDSAFNLEDLAALGVPRERCRLAPPLHRVEELGQAPLDNAIVGACRGGAVHLLFVGALRPNKGHCRALDVLAAYRRLSGAPCRLILAGRTSPDLDAYVRDVRRHAAGLGIEKYVEFALSIGPSQLRSYYYAASLFLCVSGHEGFCVPLIEAMYFRLPVVAWGSSAIGETAGGAGLVFDDYDPLRLAEAIDECAGSPWLGRDLASRGRRRYDTLFRPQAIQARLHELVEEVAG